jgi:hypothetical protein
MLLGWCIVVCALSSWPWSRIYMVIDQKENTIGYHTSPKWLWGAPGGGSACRLNTLEET